VASDSHRSRESFVLPEEMYGKFGIASTICSLIETGYPGVLPNTQKLFSIAFACRKLEF